MNDLLNQGDAQATKLERSKAITTYLKAADFIKKKCNVCNNNNNLDDSNYCNSSAKCSYGKHPVHGCVVKRLNVLIYCGSIKRRERGIGILILVDAVRIYT